MTNILNGGFLSGKKTYITSGVTVLGAIASYLVGDVNLVDTFQLIVTGALAGFLRAGVDKT